MRVIDKDTVAIVIDVQEKLAPHMENCQSVIEQTARCIRGLDILDIPIILTEQYPKGLGPTVPEIASVLPDTKPMVKSAFSCCDDQPFLARLRESGRRSVIVTGIESHVCVLQTTIDLVELGFDTVVATDCTSSRSIHDRDIAFRRMEREGARLTTFESILFELTRYSGTPRFREISRLVK